MKDKIIHFLSFILKSLSLVVGLKTLPFLALLPPESKPALLAAFLFVIASTLKELVYFILDFTDNGKLDGSYKLALVALVLIPAALMMASCAARPDGTKTFGGLDAAQWGGVGVQAGSAYLSKRAEPVPSGKTTRDVTPAPAPAPTWWGLLGL